MNQQIQQIRVYMVRTYASYYNIVNENNPHDHGARDNTDAYIWIHDIEPDDPDMAMPEPSTTPNFDASWIVGVFQTENDAHEAYEATMNMLIQKPDHVRNYNVMIEPIDMIIAQNAQDDNNPQDDQDDQDDEEGLVG